LRSAQAREGGREGGREEGEKGLRILGMDLRIERERAGRKGRRKRRRRRREGGGHHARDDAGQAQRGVVLRAQHTRALEQLNALVVVALCVRMCQVSGTRKGGGQGRVPCGMQSAA
jgi:hypothetical protein